MLALATSAEHVAVACSSGEIRLFSAATLELAAVLPCPPQAPGAMALSCAFDRTAAQLVASYSGGGGGSLLACWSLGDLQRLALVPASQRQAHRWAGPEGPPWQFNQS